MSVEKISTYEYKQKLKIWLDKKIGELCNKLNSMNINTAVLSTPEKISVALRVNPIDNIYQVFDVSWCDTGYISYTKNGYVRL